MADKTIIAALLPIMAIALAGAVLGQDIFVNNGILTGPCNSYSDVAVTLHDTTNNVWWTENAIILNPIPNVYIYSATFNGVANNAQFRVYANATGKNPCKATGNATTTAATGGSLEPPTTVIGLDIMLKYSMGLVSPIDESYNTNRTTFNWSVEFEGTPEFHLVIDDDADFSSPIRNITVTNAFGYRLTVPEELPESRYYWYVDLYNLSGRFLQRSESRSFHVTSGSIALSNFLPTGWQNSTSVLMSFTTSEAAACRFSYSSGDFFSKTAMSNTGGISHSTMVSLSADGGNNIYIMCSSPLGYYSAENIFTINRDTGNPNHLFAHVTINGGDAYTSNTTLSVGWQDFVDTVSGIAGYYYGFSWATRNYTTSQNAIIEGALNGGRIVYVWPVDNAGNVGGYAWDSIIVDTHPPNLNLVRITNLDKYTTTDINVRVSASDTSPLEGGVPMIRYKKWNQSWSAWLSMAAHSAYYDYNIPQSPDSWADHIGEFLYIEVYARDIHGFTSNLNISDEINNVSSPPIIYNPGTKNTYQGVQINFTVRFYDPDGDVLAYDISEGTITKFNDSLAIVSYTPGPLDVGVKHLIVTARDGQNTVNRTIIINVLNVNDAPYFSTTNTVNFVTYVYNVFSARFNATDLDDDPLAFSSNNSVFPVSTTTGEMRGYPKHEDRGLHRINLTVSDGTLIGHTLVTVDVKYCGDAICSTPWEDCGICSQDCGECDTKDSAAIIIYPRNCLESTMTIKVVKLVQRATCDVKGLIIDNKEVCGNMSNQEIHLERIVNGTYEQIATLITDEYGIVTFLPDLVGTYRISLKSFEINTEFTTKECIEDEKSQTVPATIVTQKTTTIGPVERPQEIILTKEGRDTILYLLLFLVIPALSGMLTFVFSRYYYQTEVRKIRRREKEKSSYVEWMDRNIIRYWAIVRLWTEKRVIRHPASQAIADTIENTIRAPKKLILSLWKSTSNALSRIGIIKKAKVFQIQFYDIKNMDDKRKNEVIAISIAKYLLPKIVTKDIIGKITGFSTPHSELRLADIGASLAEIGLKVEYADNRIYKSGEKEIESIKRAMKRGAKYTRQAYSIEEIKRMLGKRAAAAVEIVTVDTLDEKRFIRFIAPIVGFDNKNIIIHDYNSMEKEKKISLQLFEKARKNAHYRVIIVRK